MYADFYNAKNPPKKVDFLDAYVLELRDRPGRPICAVEKFIEGEYKKYNNNWNWSDDLRNTPQVFTHTGLSLSLSLSLSEAGIHAYRSLPPSLPHTLWPVCTHTGLSLSRSLSRSLSPQAFSHLKYEQRDLQEQN